MSKIFVGFVKVKEVTGGAETWEYTQISFKADDLEKMAKYQNSAGFINLKLNRSKKGGEYLEIDTWGLEQDVPEIAQTPPAMHKEPVADEQFHF
jgi:hypothetical protein